MSKNKTKLRRRVDAIRQEVGLDTYIKWVDQAKNFSNGVFTNPYDQLRYIALYVITKYRTQGRD